MQSREHALPAHARHALAWVLALQWQRSRFPMHVLAKEEIHALVGEVRRVLRPGGVFVYTVRHTGDAHYGAGTGHGDDIWEHGGFAVHFFPRDLVDALADGWQSQEVHPFEEGDLPRRLWRVTQTLPR
ncbi:hypothetical protein [Streptomyces sp. NPDC057580]|uniref:hypothetical protein n=1 Tax=Streptomyces sp. NPDC057580 TaxID=3346173 RepID=UPI0036CFE6CA